MDYFSDEYDDFEAKLKAWAMMSGNSSMDLVGAGADDGNLSHAKLQEILNSGEISSSSHMDGRHILVIILSALAVIINAVTLTAIVHIRRRLTANQTMMFSLCCADLLTAVGVMARVINQQVFELNTVDDEQRVAATCVYKIIQAVIFTGHNTTLCNLLGLSVDHYCAIAKPLTYSIYMSKRRVHTILAVFWTASVVFGFSEFLIPAPLHKYCEAEAYTNYCLRVYCSKFEPDHLMFSMVLLCLLVMTIMYGCIMCILYRYQRQQYATVSQRKAQRHIRGLITSFIILGLFAVLWLPNCIMDAYAILRMTLAQDISVHKIHQQVYWYLYALVILNAICDPIVYAMRMREIQGSLKILMCFKRPTFSNKMNGFGDNLKQNSTSSIPLKYVQRQCSNSTNVTICSGSVGAGGSLPYSMTSTAPLIETNRTSRHGTISSQVGQMSVSEADEEDDEALEGRKPVMSATLQHQDTNLSLLEI